MNILSKIYSLSKPTYMVSTISTQTKGFSFTFVMTLLLMALVQSVNGQVAEKKNTPSREHLNEVIKKSENSIYFIENKGQWTPDILMQGHTNVGQLQIRKDQIHFVSAQELEEEGEEHEEEEYHEETYVAHGWSMFFEGANPNFRVGKHNELLTKYSYFIGNDPSHHAGNVSSFGETSLDNIYDGIDLRMYSQKNQTIEFDWIVRAGADFRNIKMRYKGQDALSIDKNGDLVVGLRFDKVHFDIPESYQIINGVKVPVKMSFQLNDNTVSFRAESNVDSRYDLVIDPSLKWGTWFDNNSGSFDEYLFAVETDFAGNVYCGGNTNQSILTTYGGAPVFGYDPSYNEAGTGGNGANRDGIIYQISTNGTSILRITYFGSSSPDAIYGMGFSPDNSTLYVCGYAGGNIPTTADAFDATRSGLDGFVAVFPANLSSLLYSTYIGGTGSDRLVAVRGLSNNSFVTGGRVAAALTTAAPNYILNAYDASYDGGNDIYIAKFTSFNSLTFGTYVSGSGADDINDLQVFSDGSIVFCGNTASSAASLPGLVNAAGTTSTNTDAIVGVIPPNGGTFSMFSEIGGTGNDYFNGLGIGPNDTIYLTGYTTSTNFPLGAGASAATRLRATSIGGEDGIIGKLPRTGNSGAGDPWVATYFGGSGNDRGNTIRTYAFGTGLMIFGETGSSVTTGTNRFPVQNLDDGGTFYDSTFNGGTWDIFWLATGTNLQQEFFCTYVGGSQNDYLGETGTPAGSNHFIVEGDSLLVLGTTVHSTTLEPAVIGPTTGSNAVYDISRTGTNDDHLIFKWRIGSLFNFDFGDAPVSYGRARHTIFNTIRLGSIIDKEDFYPVTPGTRANFDDLNSVLTGNPDDEDAIAGSQILIRDTATRYTVTVPVVNTTGQTATVAAWIDFNGNGRFDCAEVDTARVANGGTSATLSWTGFTWTSATDTSYMRIRISTDAAFNVACPPDTLSAGNGEVEDYLVIKFHCVNLTAAVVDTTSPTTCGGTNGSIRISNTDVIAGLTYTVSYTLNGTPQPAINITVATNGVIVIPNLGAGTYTNISISHPTNPACGGTLAGPYYLRSPALPSPPTSVSASPTPLCSGNTLTLTATGSNLVWTFPAGGGTANGSPVTRTNVTTAMSGTYTVTQTVNNCTSAPASIVVTVNPTPAAPTSVTVSPNPVCTGQQITLSAAGLAGSTFTWTLPNGGGTQTGNPLIIPSATAANGGVYSVIQTTAAGCPSASTNSATLVVNPTPAAPTNVTGNPNPICTGQTLTLTAAGVTGATFNWTTPDGAPLSGNPATRTNVTLAMGGNYLVTQTSSGCTSPASAPVNVVVNQTPTAPTSVTVSPNPVCTGQQITLSASGIAGSTFTWTLPNGGGTQVGNPLVISNVTAANAGVYSVIQTTPAGCTSPSANSSSLVVNPTPAAPTNVTANINPICAGQTLTLSASGLGGSTFNWSGPNGFTQTGNPISRTNVTSAMAGSYTVTQTTAAGCTSAPSAPITITINPVPSITAGSSSSSYCAGTTIQLNSTPSGGTPGYTFTWSGPNGFVSSLEDPTRGPATAAMAGAYTVVVTDANSCTASATTSAITINPGLAPTASSNSPVCAGGAINLSSNPSGGTVPITYTWSGPNGFNSGAQSPSISGASAANAGTYSLTVSDVNGCSGTTSTSVVVNPATVVNVTSNTPVCEGSTLNLLATPTSGVGPFTYNWSGPNGYSSSIGNPSRTNSQLSYTGTYNVTVTDANGCSGTGSGAVVINPRPSITASSNSEICSGATLNLTSSPSGGTPPYAFSWSGPGGYVNSSQSPSIAATTTANSGTYTVLLTDGNTCTATASTVVVVNQSPNADAGTSTTVCRSEPLTLGGSPTASSGTPGYTYSWSGGLPAQSNPIVNPTSNSSYSLTVTDSKGCTATSSISVNVNSNPTAEAGSDKTIASCSTVGAVLGGSPAASGGVGPYSYLWSPGSGLTSTTSANPTVQGIGSTTVYTLTVTDANGCTASDQVTVNVTGSTLTVVIVPNTSLFWCAGTGGQVTLSAIPTGGTGPYTFDWTGAFMSNTTGTFTTVNPNAAGTYNYSVLMTDATGCQAGATIPVNVFVNPTASAGPGATVCNSQPVTLGGAPTASGGTTPYTYSWTNGAASVANPTVSPSVTTTYTVVVTDSNSCSSSSSATVTIRSNPIADAGVDRTLSSCSPTGVQIGGGPTASGGSGFSYSYAWSPATGLSSTTSSNPTVQGIASTQTYTVVVTDGNGCTASDQVVVTLVNNAPIVSISSSGSTSWCANSGGSTNLTASVSSGTPSYSYNWSGSFISPVNSQVATVNPSTANTYNYTVTVTDALNCTASASASITVNSNPTASAGSNVSTCSGTAVQIGGSPSATGGTSPYSYAWNNGASAIANPSVNPISNTTYTLTVTDNNGCTSTSNTTVIVRPNPTASAGSNVTLSSCSPSGVLIGGTPTASGGDGIYTYAWSPTGGLSSSSVANPTVQGIASTTTYTVTVTDGAGCSASSQVVVSVVNNSPTVNITSSGSTSWCEASASSTNLTANITGGSPTFSYSWSGTSISPTNSQVVTVNPNVTGTFVYNVTVTDGFNCTASATRSITVNPRPTSTGNASSICAGNTVTLGGSPSASGGTSPYTYSWSGGAAPSANPTVNPTGTTTYILLVTDANGCTATSSSTVTVRPNPVADAGIDRQVNPCVSSCVTIGGTPTGSGSSAPYSYSWSPATNLSSTTISNPQVCALPTTTSYSVVVTDATGCTSSDVVVVSSVASTLTAEAGSGGALCLGSGDSIMLGGFPTAVGGAAPYTYTWSPSAGLNTTNTANPEAFPATTTKYFVTVTDLVGCTSIDSTTVTVYPTLTANAGRDTLICAGFPAQLGSSPTASGGSGSGYTYIWSPTNGLSSSVAANPTASPAVSTIYFVIVTDGNGCTATDNVNINVRNNPVANAGPDKTLTTCPGDSVFIGAALAATGGTGPYTYSWSPASGLSSTSVANPFVRGISSTTTYTLTVTDANGCTSVDAVIVTVAPSTLSASAGPNHEVCLNTCVQLGNVPTATGGTSPYLYSWSGNSLSSSSASNPVACPTVTSTYTLTVTDSKGCTSTSTVSVVVNPRPISNAGPDRSVCSGSTVQIGGSPSATGGTPGYTYLWDPTVGLSLANVPNPLASPIAVTTYQLVVTDSKGCTNVDEVVVTPQSTPVVDAGSDKNLFGCVQDTTFIGNIPVVVSGGTGPFSYLWSPSTGLSSTTVQNPTVTGLSSTTSYQIRVTDSFGCEGIDYVIVNVLQTTLQANAGNGASICANSGSNVTIGGAPTAVGGTPPYTYNWSNGSTVSNPVVSPVTTTLYYVTVTDSKGCTSVDSVRVSLNGSVTVSAGRDTAVCAGFPVILGGTPTASGGTAPYQYTWTPPVGINANNVSNPVAVAPTSTIYVVNVVDSNGCTGSASVRITVRPTPTADAGPDKSITGCIGDTVTIGGSPSASGGSGTYTYSWSPSTLLSSTTVSNPRVVGLTTSQNYGLLVTDAFGCTSTDAVLVSYVVSTLQAEAGLNRSICSGASSTVTLGGSPTAIGGTSPYTYTWSTGATTANPVVTPSTTTTYYVTVVDAKGCTATDSIRITVRPQPTANAGSDTTICSEVQVRLGGGLTATGGGGGPYTYAWSPTVGLSNSTVANPIATPTATTTYCVTVTDVNGCTASSCLIVTVNPRPRADAGPDRSLIACSSDSVRIGGSPSATGGSGLYTYSWSPNIGLSSSTDPNPWVSRIGSTTSYTLVVVDQNTGCSASDQVQVTINNTTLVAEAGNDVTFCEGSAVSVTIGGAPTAVGGVAPFTYRWYANSVLVPSLNNVPNPLVSPTVSTVYTVEVTDAAGCVASDFVTITINPRPLANAGLPDTICAGECRLLGSSQTASLGTPPYSYLWTPSTNLNSNSIPNPQACPTATTTYTVTVTDSLGCSNSSSVTIRVNSNPVVNAGQDVQLVNCELSSVQIGGSPTASSGTAPYSYAWSPGIGLNSTGVSNPIVSGISASQVYTVVVFDNNGCTSTDDVLVTLVQSTLLADAGPDKSICAGQSSGVLIGGQPTVQGGTLPYNIQWTPVSGLNSFTIQNPTANPTSTTTYVILVSDALGCVSSDSMVLTANPQVTVAVSYSDSVICAGTCIALGGNPTASGGTAGYTYTWNPGTGLNSITASNPVACPQITTTYGITVTDNVGCSSSTTQTITVNPNPTANAGPDKSMTQCPGAFTYLGGTPTATGGSGNYFYSWSPGTGLNGTTLPNPIVTNLTVTTTYCVTITDAVTGCTSTDCMILTVTPSNLQADAGLDQLYCANSSSCVPLGGAPTASGGSAQYIYQWSPSAGLNFADVANPCANPTSTTKYYVTVTDAQGCFSVDSVNVFVGSLIAADAGSDISICSGSSAQIGGNPTGFGGTGTLTYSWAPGNNLSATNVANPNVIGLTAPATYTVIVRDSLGCSATDLVAVSIRLLPTANAGPDVVMTACSADTAVLGGNPTATGTVAPYTYNWFPPVQGLITNTSSNPLITNLGSSTLFTVVVTDTFGCSAQDQVQVTVLPNTVIANAGGGSVSPICAGSGQCVTIGGVVPAIGGVPPYTYNWLPAPGLTSNLDQPNPIACPTQTTTYTLLVADANGCSSFDTVRVIVNSPPVASISGLAGEYCGNSPQVVMQGLPSGPTGFFSGNGVSGNVFSPSLAGAGTWDIRYVYTDPATGCLDDTVISVTVHPAPVVSVTGVDNQYCLYAPVDTFFGVPAGGIFTGPGMSGNTFDPQLAGLGNHSVNYTYIDQFGCSGTINFTVRVVPAPTITLATATGRDTVCAGSSIVVVPTYSIDVFNIFWYDINGTQLSSGLNPIAVNPTGVDYAVIAEAISTPGFCRSRDTIYIHVNQSPVASADAANMCEDETVDINAIGNDADPEGDANSIIVSTQPQHGVVVNNNGVFTYTPTPNYNGVDSFAYTICNIQCPNACSTAWVTINICSINDNPTITPVVDTTCRNEYVLVCPLISDVDGDALTVTANSCSGTLNGTITFADDSCFRYTPNSWWYGTDTICMTVCDGSNACASATAVITVLPCNHKPNATDDNTDCAKYTTPFIIDVLDNDTDVDSGDILTVVGFPCPPLRGTAVINNDGTITYTPGPNATALAGDTFCYVVCDNGLPVLCDTAFVRVCIQNSVVAVDDNVTTGQFNPVVIPVLTNDFDPEGDNFGITGVIASGNGTPVLNPDGTVTFTPNVSSGCGYIDSFQYTIADVLGAVDTGTVYIDILCCPRPVAVDDYITMIGNTTTTYNILANDTLSGTPLVTTVLSGPMHGAVQLNNGVITYTPVTNYCNNFDTIVYSIASICGRDTATVYIHVKCNRAPVVANDAVSVCVDSLLNFQPLLNDVDPDTGDVLTVVAITIPTPNLGSATLVGNTVVFAPNGTLGTASITYQVCDNGVPSLCSTGTITITVDTSCYRHAPITNTMYDTTFINTTLSACADSFVVDIDGDQLSITGFCDNADNGTVQLGNGLCFNYTPNSGFVGNDTFCLVVCDQTGLCSNLTVIITVLDTIVIAVDDPCDLYTTVIGTSVSVPVLANDIIPIATDTVVTIISNPANGNVTSNGTTVLYTPTPTFVGADQFTYVVCAVTRNFSFCDTATACVTVEDTTCTIPNGFSPNGDGVNDVFVIPCNEDFPKADLIIYSRWGDEVWRSKGHYNNDWDGKNQQNTILPDGTYYLIYSYNDGTNRREARFVVIHR